MASQATLPIAVLVAGAAVLPAFTVGALGPRIRSELGITAAILGLSVGGSFLIASLTSRTLGKLAGRISMRAGSGGALLLSGLALVTIAKSENPVVLAIGLGIGGLSVALGHPTVNGMLASSARSPLGRAMSFKQAGVPTGTMLAGLALPVCVPSLGWRNTVLGLSALLGVGLVGVLAFVPSTPRVTPQPRTEVQRDGHPSVVPLSLGGALAAIANSGMAIFIVEAGVESGMGEGASGLLLIGSSCLGLATQVSTGWMFDRGRVNPVPAIACLLAAGSIGYLFVATGIPVLIMLGSLVAFGFGWGWPTLYHLSLATGSRQQAAEATGRGLVGVTAGAGVGPIVVGFIISHLGHRPAWIAMSGMSVAGGLTIWKSTSAARIRSSDSTEAS